MSSVKNYLRRQADVNHFPTTSSRANHNTNSPEVERPLSEYDNLNISTLQSQLADIKFRFDDIASTSTAANMSSSSSQNNSNNNNNISTIPKYENVIDTVQMRNKRESDQQREQQVKMDHNDSIINRPVISEAKSSFFGLNQQSQQQQHTPAIVSDDDLEKLIEDCANIKIVSSNDIQQYVNLINNNNDDAKDNSPTSSASGSSAITVSPSSSPKRDGGVERKNSEAGSHRSKSPKFVIPSPSQV